MTDAIEAAKPWSVLYNEMEERAEKAEAHRDALVQALRTVLLRFKQETTASQRQWFIERDIETALAAVIDPDTLP